MRNQEPAAPQYEDKTQETQAIAMIALDNLQGTDNWAWLCPAILVLSAAVSVGWLWQTHELVTERKGYVLMGLLFTAYSVMVLSKHVRDEQYAEALDKYARHTSFYHESTVKQLRGTDAFRAATRFGLLLAAMALFGGLWMMPFESGSKWMIAQMCINTISNTFVYANQKRNVDTARQFMRALQAQPQ